MNSDMLRDKNARQFYEVVAEIKRTQPVIFLLENVLGITRVLQFILRHLHSAGRYFIWEGTIDPLNLGCPLSRRRIYFVGIRRDKLQKKSDDALNALAKNILQATCCVSHSCVS